MNWGRLLVAGWCLFSIGCGAQASGGENGGNTSWVRFCEQDSHCSGDKICVAQACLSPCETNSDCGGDGLTCQAMPHAEWASVDACAEASQTERCTASCTADTDCAELGDQFMCQDSHCAPTCLEEPKDEEGGASGNGGEEQDPPADIPDSDLSGDREECVMAADVSQCCAAVNAYRSSQVNAEECLVEVRDGQLASDPPASCLSDCGMSMGPADCDFVTRLHMIVTEHADGCELVAPCPDGECPGAACDPRLGCNPNWTCDTELCEDNFIQGLTCVSDSCGQEGVCQLVPSLGCDGNYNPVCGCDGTTYGNFCEASGAPVDYASECANCYAPTSNVESAGTGELPPCECSASEERCVADAQGNLLNFVCTAGAWSVEETGPCDAYQEPDLCVVAFNRSRCCGSTAATIEQIATDPCLVDSDPTAPITYSSPGECPRPDCSATTCANPTAQEPIMGDDGQCTLAPSSCSYPGQMCSADDCCDGFYCVDDWCQSQPRANPQ